MKQEVPFLKEKKAYEKEVKNRASWHNQVQKLLELLAQDEETRIVDEHVSRFVIEVFSKTWR